MLTFELSQLISRYLWRWIFGIGVLCLDLLFYLNSQTSAPNSIWEFTFSFLTSPSQSMLILPVLFLLITIDVIRLDITSNFIQFLTVRATARTNWFIAKLTSLFAMSVLYTILVVNIPLVIGMLGGLDTSYVIGEYSVFFQTTPLTSLIGTTLPTFIITFTTLGTMFSILSLYTHHHSVSLVVGTLICLLSYFTYVRYHDIGIAFKWMLTTHMFLLPKIPTKLFSSNNFSAPSFAWSYGYLLCLYITSVILGYMRVRKTNL